MNNHLQTILTSTVTAVTAIAVSLTMGFGKHTAQTIHLSDGNNIEQIVTVLNDKVDKVIDVITEGVKAGDFKKFKTNMFNSINETYKQESEAARKAIEAARKAAEAARKAAKAKKQAKKDNLGAQIFGNTNYPSAPPKPVKSVPTN